MNTTANVNQIYNPIPKTIGYFATAKGQIFKKENQTYILLNSKSDAKGYLRISVKIDDKIKSMYVHQLIAMAFLNHVPCGNEMVVDHINSIKTDNRVENLRVVSQRFNITKERVGSGKGMLTGITWHKRDKKWQSQIGFRKRKIYLGSFKSKEDAAKKYEDTLELIKKVESILRETG